MEYKEFTEEEFEKFCEDHALEMPDSFWDCIKEQKVIIEMDTNDDLEDTELGYGQTELTVKFLLTEG